MRPSIFRISFLILLVFCITSGTLLLGNILPSDNCKSILEASESSTVTYLIKKGRVPPGLSAIFNFRSRTTQVRFHIIKQRGPSTGRVEIYIDGALKERLEYGSSSSNIAKAPIFNNVAGKNFRVKIIHESGEDAFHYDLRSSGDNLPKIIKPNKSCPRAFTSGTVQAGQVKTMTIKPLCNEIEIIIHKTGGSAAAEVTIYLDNIFTSRLRFPKGPANTQKKILSPLNGRTIKIEIANLGASGSTFNYRMETIQRE